jgi:predicted membrane protein
MESLTAHYTKDPQTSSDRSFGIVFCLFFLLVALQPIISGLSIRLWAMGVSLAFVAISIFAPAILAPLNRIWTKIGLLMHAFISPITLGVLFFVVITPIGFCVRLFGKDSLRLKMDKDVSTYWVVRTPSGVTPESFKNQF